MILSYPFNIGPTGLSITDKGVDSQLSMLFNTHPGVRLFYPDYGISVMGLEQELLHDWAKSGSNIVCCFRVR